MCLEVSALEIRELGCLPVTPCRLVLEPDVACTPQLRGPFDFLAMHFVNRLVPERRHFLRNPKWGPSDFGCKKLGDGHGLRRSTFVPTRTPLVATLPRFPVLLRRAE